MIDIALSSCGRIDVLEKSITSCLKHLKSKEEMGIIICEDKVDNKNRQENGKKWIEDHSNLFKKIVYSEKKLTYVFCFSEILKHVESDFFVRLEDDVEFDQDIDVDSIICFMKTEPNLAELIFKREVHPMVRTKDVKNNTGRRIVYTDFFSVATGIYNTDLTRKIVALSGTEECHESSVLTPSMKKLGLSGGTIYGLNRDNALRYIGDNLGYVKGSWK